jgi:hypothetical protein
VVSSLVRGLGLHEKARRDAMKLAVIALFVFLLNVPFGYWRANVRKFSLQWILAIHAPIPFVIAMRILSGLGFHWVTYPVMLAAYFAGQFSGARIYKAWSRVQAAQMSSCLFMDFLRRWRLGGTNT